MKILLQKQDDVMYPYDDEAVELVQKIKPNQIVTCDIKRPRNPLFHRRAFKMMTILYDMIEVDAAFDAWRKWLLIQAGFCTTTGFPDGSVLVEADSLSFENMDEDKFQKTWAAIHQKFVDLYGERLTQEELNEWARM